MKWISLALALSTLTVSVCNAAQIDEWMRQLEHPRYASDELRERNDLGKYLVHDFSSLMIPRNPFLGYIGDDFKRLNITFHNIHRDTSKPDVYLVTGVSNALPNLGMGTDAHFPGNDFRGTVTLIQVREYKVMHYGVDDFYKEERPKAEGILIGRFRFEEDPGQPYSGTFEGVVTLNWILDRKGVLLYDDIKRYSSDNFRNNQYVGTWTPYKKGKSLVANWGERRIPFSDDLDVGAAEFSPNPKYRQNGWEDFQRRGSE